MQQQQSNSQTKYASKYITRYSPHQNIDKQKQLSPWSSIDQYKRNFKPSHYYQTITKQHKLYNKSLQNNLTSLPVNISLHPFANRISKDFANLVKLQNKGAFIHCEQKKNGEYPIKRNLVMVNLQENPQDNLQKPNETIFHHLSKSRHQQSKIQKEQPMHVKIFKKLRLKNKAKKQFVEQEMQISLPYEPNKSQTNDNSHVYQVMPKRSLRLTNYRQKILNSSFQSTKNEYFPKIGRQRSQKVKLQPIYLFCKGEIIQKSISSQQNKNKSKNESILSLQEYSLQR